VPAFILRNLDPEFWARVQAKAAAEGVPVKALILRLLGQWLAAVAVLSTMSCAYENPTQSTTPVAQPTPGVPSRIELSATPGVGAEAGSGAITARVLDGLAAALQGQMVTFKAESGELGASQVVTDDKGLARTTISGPAGPISISASVGAVEQKTLIAIQSPPPTSLPPGPPPTTTTTTTTVPPIVTVFPDYQVILTTNPEAPVAGNPLTLVANVTLVGTPPTPDTYAWDCTNDGVADGVTGAGVSTFTGCVFPSSPTSRTITAKVIVGDAATLLAKTATATIVIAATPAPVITLSCNSPTWPAVTSCNASAKVAGVQVPSASVHRVEWDWGDHTTDATSTNTHTHKHPSAGEWTIVARVTIVGNPSISEGVVTATVK